MQTPRAGQQEVDAQGPELAWQLTALGPLAGLSPLCTLVASSIEWMTTTLSPVPSPWPRAVGYLQRRAEPTSQVAAKGKGGAGPAPPPGQTPFPLNPQEDCDCLAQVPLSHPCSPTAQGQVYKVSPVTSLLVFWGLVWLPRIWQRAHLWSIPRVFPRSVTSTLFSPPDPRFLAEGQAGHTARYPPPGGLRPGQSRGASSSREGQWRYSPGRHPSTLCTQHGKALPHAPPTTICTPTAGAH